MLEDVFQYRFDEIKRGGICQRIELQFTYVIISVEFNNPNIKEERALIDKLWQNYVCLHKVLLREIGRELNREVLTDSQALLVDEYIAQMKQRVEEDRTSVNKKIVEKTNRINSAMFFSHNEPSLLDRPYPLKDEEAANYPSYPEQEDKGSLDYLLNEETSSLTDELMTDYLSEHDNEGRLPSF